MKKIALVVITAIVYGWSIGWILSHPRNWYWSCAYFTVVILFIATELYILRRNVKMNNNLPPGCTSNDIERAAGTFPVECERCGTIVKEACTLDDEGLCIDCHTEKLLSVQVNNLSQLGIPSQGISLLLKNKDAILEILNRE